MRIDVVTIFPEFFTSALQTSLLGKAIATGLVDVTPYDLRVHGSGNHRSVDDVPYGGGAGMVMRPEPIFDAVERLAGESSHVVLLSPRGARLDQSRAEALATKEHLILICGRYEGVDERVAEHLAHEELSIGDYVLSGGEAAALVVIDAVTRLRPGVMGNEVSLAHESFGPGSSGGLEHAQYTRPAEFRDWPVPEVLLSGNHAAIEKWRAEEAARATRERRPDLG
jgi:tRNA (guanine37-N1)-methyltransferase